MAQHLPVSRLVRAKFHGEELGPMRLINYDDKKLFLSCISGDRYLGAMGLFEIGAEYKSGAGCPDVGRSNILETVDPNAADVLREGLWIIGKKRNHSVLLIKRNKA